MDISRSEEETLLEKAARILESRFSAESREGISSPSEASKIACLRLGTLEHEAFAVFWLDAQNRLIAFEQLFRGTLTQTSVYPREVAKSALRHNAAAALLAHNHPSGCAEPSSADRMVTETLKTALALFEIRVVDHLIVGIAFDEHGGDGPGMTIRGHVGEATGTNSGKPPVSRHDRVANTAPSRAQVPIRPRQPATERRIPIRHGQMPTPRLPLTWWALFRFPPIRFGNSAMLHTMCAGPGSSRRIPKGSFASLLYPWSGRRPHGRFFGHKRTSGKTPDSHLVAMGFQLEHFPLQML